MKQLRIAVIVCFSLFCFCGKKAMLRKYYLIEIPAAAEADSVQIVKLPATLDIRDFQISRSINQTRIAMRSNTNELDYYFYHLWAVRPSAGVADLIYEVMNNRIRSNRLIRGYSSRPDYIVTGSILHFEWDETEKKVSAHVSGDIDLIDEKTGNPVLRHHFNRREPIEKEKNMNSFAQRISQILVEETDRFISQITEYFNQNLSGAAQ
jgi:ABC-type uncharacterized transport system auxiliary subunit